MINHLTDDFEDRPRHYADGELGAPQKGSSYKIKEASALDLGAMVVVGLGKLGVRVPSGLVANQKDLVPGPLGFLRFFRFSLLGLASTSGLHLLAWQVSRVSNPITARRPFFKRTSHKRS